VVEVGFLDTRLSGRAVGMHAREATKPRQEAEVVVKELGD
jgi:hypothetical protein